jgi:hypothetical protein
MAQHELYVLSNVTGTRLTPLGSHSGMDITLQNVNNSGFIYIGGEGVTSLSYGYRIPSGHAWSVELNGQDSLFAIAETDGMSLAKLAVSLEGGS